MNRRRAEPAMAADDDHMVSAPVELKRLIQTALHGAGLQLGEAMEVADAVLFHDAMHAPKAGCLPDLLSRRFPGKALPHVISADSDLMVNNGGASVLQAACIALDWVSCHASTHPRGVSRAFVGNTLDAAVLVPIAMRCAERGLLGVLSWSDGNRFGLAFSGAGSTGPGLVQWQLDDNPPDGIRALCARADVALAKGGVGEGMISETYGTVIEGSGAGMSGHCALMGIKLDADLSEPLFERLAQWAAEGIGMSRERTGAYSSKDIATLRQQWNRRGIVVRREHFSALSQAARQLLVPDSQEHRLRPGEVIDPLKIF
jgi:hypothetical protein